VTLEVWRARLEPWLRAEWRRTSAWQLLLLPLSWVYWALVLLQRRAWAGKLATPIPCPVIVVGNLSVGGTGKTPLTQHIVRLLVEAGYTPGVICRGTGEMVLTHDGVGDVRKTSPKPEFSPAEWYGDEALLLRESLKVPVYIGRQRAEAATRLLAAQRSVDVLVSDDGLQHYPLRRDIELVVVDGVGEFGNGRLLPAGPLREPVSRLARVDAVIVHGKLRKKNYPVPTFRMTLREIAWVNVESGERVPAQDLAARFTGQRLMLIAGIGDPERFFAQARGLGLAGETRAFPDHHPYAAEEVEFPGIAAVLMTEKDAVKCRQFPNSARFWFLAVEAVLSDDFAPWLLGRLKEVNGRKAA
jgi:tetraacyldisaccharide 4'-kinase